MIITIGTYKCKVDPKGRFYFPSEFKRQLTQPVVDQGFVLKKSVFYKGLELYSKPNFDELIRKDLASLNRFNKEEDMLQREFHRHVITVEIDGSGRILIPKFQLEYAKIKDELIIQSVIDRFCIWSKEEYENLEMTTEQIAGLIEKILGKSTSSGQK